MKKIYALSLLSLLMSISCVSQSHRSVSNTNVSTTLTEIDDESNTNHLEKTITLGETINFNEENIRITFEEVIKDSRCPKEARCKSPGVFQAKLKIKGGKFSSSKKIILSDRKTPELSYDNQYIYNNHIIEITGVYPRKSVRKTKEKIKIGVTITPISK